VRKLSFLFFLCLCAAATLPGRAGAVDQCGRPDRTTNWIDYGSIMLTDVLARPGTMLAVSSGDYPAQVRTRGAVTLYWDMYLNKSRVGTPTAPADPDVVVTRANRLFDFAVQQSACPTPWIAENELAGASLESPWSASNEQYRANVLLYLKTLAARGARPFLLVNSTPYTGGEAAAWWQQVAEVADIVRETYFNAKKLHAQGPLVGNRTIREALRTSVGRFLAIGIPPARLGVMLGFQTAGTSAGRAGLTPRQAWFDVVKWQGLAARQVAQELNFSTIWSWGWGTWTKAEQDPDKIAAACVWLWTRAPALCDGPGAAGPTWNASRTEGQLLLKRGVQCTVGPSRLTAGEIDQLAFLTGDRDIAYSALFARLVESRTTRVAPAEVFAAERAVIAARFNGNASAYQTALAQAGASPVVARGILEDELRRARIAQTLSVGPPSAAAIETFYESYPDLLVRAVTASPAPQWLGWKSEGLALDSIAPASLFTLPTRATRRLQTIHGQYTVRASGESQPMGAIPLSIVEPAIRAALVSFAQNTRFEQWTTKQQRAALAVTTCRQDDLPSAGPTELESFLPFLAATG
jgi:hypothetical protein